MKIDIEMLAGQQLKAKFGNHEIISDQSESVGGLAEYPEPFDYFLASMPLCVGFYIRRFCNARDISTEGISISQENENIGDDNYKKKFKVTVTLPDDFPKKYRKAVLSAANTCTVKKVIQALPEFEISLED